METIVLGTAALGFGSLFLAFLAYFLPWIIALLRGTKSNVGIFFLNLIFGWTFIGWLVALVWAFVAERKNNQPQQIIVIKEAK
ncbi:immunity to superinfection [Salmonella phage STML-198]|uniref:Immunity to superinfection membrane protein n=2 Tax=Gelderlandvirus TaxID=1913653 RepID=K4IFA4_9CAUD|nr:immunity to superinfection [Salmonella phage STML-198]YP_009615522.1 immunity to superinfection [Salmonella phage Melville]AFU63989.1 hypothetical protein [Salmonella phage STML-198]ATN93010.1 Imm-like immunity to superinfection membrane protein [Salmonella phage Melville]UPW42411.1 immunity protein [Salmonella phage CF-SP2]